MTANTMATIPKREIPSIVTTMAMRSILAKMGSSLSCGSGIFASDCGADASTGVIWVLMAEFETFIPLRGTFYNCPLGQAMCHLWS